MNKKFPPFLKYYLAIDSELIIIKKSLRLIVLLGNKKLKFLTCT